MELIIFSATYTDCPLPGSNITGNCTTLEANQTKSYQRFVTVSSSLPFWNCPAARWTLMVAAIINLIFGSIGNLLSFITMLQPSLRSITICYYFITISVADFIFVVLISVDTFTRQLSFGSIDVALSLSCQPFKFLGFTCTYISSLSLACVHIERVIAVYKPFLALHWLTPNKSKVCIACIITFSIALSSNIFFLYEVSEVNGKPQCSVNAARYPTYASLFFSIEPIFYSTIPLIIIFGSNALILFKLLHRRVSGHHTANKGRPSEDNAIESEQKETFERQTKKVQPMLLIVSCAFIVCTGPLSIVATIRYSPLRHLLVIDLQDPNVCLIYTGIASVIVLYHLNYAINFYMYVISGEKFRREVKQLLRLSNGKRTIPKTPNLSTINTVSGSVSVETGLSI